MEKEFVKDVFSSKLIPNSLGQEVEVVEEWRRTMVVAWGEFMNK